MQQDLLDKTCTFDTAAVTSVSFTEQYRTRVQGFKDKTDKSPHEPTGKQGARGGLSFFPITRPQFTPFLERTEQGHLGAVCITASTGLGLTSTKMPGWTFQLFPTQSPKDLVTVAVPLWVVRKYKSGSNAGHYVQREKGLSFCSLFRPQPPLIGVGEVRVY